MINECNNGLINTLTSVNKMYFMRGNVYEPEHNL